MDKNNKFLLQLNIKNFFCLLIVLITFSLDRLSKTKIIELQINDSALFINQYINLDLVWNTGIGLVF